MVMKMTLHIDEELLDRVMRVTGADSKTHAVDLALREMVRRAELARLASEGLGMTASELREAYDPASAAADETPVLATNYGRKSRSR
jgi:Arc/MetJ family transcription regulator